ncbi:MAG: hypothetical protein GY847_38280 [Proteobacteria bacterium]|nr:hypothetical protein [Pseudomonadota bacterium]
MKLSCFMVTLLQFLLVSSELRAGEIPNNLSVPVIVIDVGHRVNSEAVDEVVRAIASPSFRGAELSKQLNLIAPLDPEFTKSIGKMFTRAEDLFFSGHDKKAEADFLEIIAKARSNPAGFSSSSFLRELVFKTHLHLAVIARGAGDSERVEQQLSLAAASFPDHTPAPVDFPPWVCSRFKAIRSQQGSPSGEIQLDAPKNCDLVLSGRELGRGVRFKEIEAGEHAVHVRCKGPTSPVQRLVIADQPVSYRPIIIANSRIDANASEFTLVFEKRASVSSIVKDVLSIASAGGWTRAVAIVGRAKEVEVWLIDNEIKGIVRRASAPPDNVKAIGEAGETLVRKLPKVEQRVLPAEKRAWYKDSLAWTFVGTGIAALSAGIVLGQVYGTPSNEESLAWALIVAGGGVIGTGVTLFFVPTYSGSAGSTIKGNDVAVGFRASFTF